MKKIILSLLVLTVVVFANAQTADEVINKYVDALGGKEKLASIKTLKMTGQLSASGLTVDIVVSLSNGVGLRTDISVPGLGDGFTLITPTKGWSYLPFQGQTTTEELPAEQVKNSQSSLDAQGILVDYKEKGYKAELLGKETVEGTECYKIKMESSSGHNITFLIDAKTYYKFRATAVVDGKELITTYSNYKKTPDGYIFPYSQETPNGPIDFSSIEINKTIEESVFKP